MGNGRLVAVIAGIVILSGAATAGGEGEGAEIKAPVAISILSPAEIEAARLEAEALTEPGVDAKAPAPADDFHKTKFANRRWEEDWTFLGDPDATTDHWYPEAKFIDLGDGWSLGFGGQIRYRLMSENNKSLTKTSPKNNDYNLVRTRVHADLRNENGLRFFVEGLDARIHGNSRPPIGIDRNNFDLQNGFVEWDAGEQTFRFGRMELQEGAQRLVSPLDWGNTRRTFDGGMITLEHSLGTTDIFVTRPVMVDPRDMDNRITDRWFSGIYNTTKLDNGDGLDVFVLALNDTDDIFTANDGSVGDRDLYTWGGRYHGKRGDTDFEAWGAMQRGEVAGDDVDAYAWTLRAGQSFPDTKYKPRVGLDVDYASGDDNPTGGDVETFNQLFPLGHAYFGYLDLVGRQNVIDIQPNVAVVLDERTKAKAAFHYFKLAEEEDAVYNAAGAPSFADASGDAGDNLGNEIDLVVMHSPEWLAPHGNLLVGWSRFWSGRHIDSAGGRGDAELYYVQLQMTF